MNERPSTVPADVGARPTPAQPLAAGDLDLESREWLRSLGDEAPERDEAVARLHALLLRAAHHEVRRRRPSLPHLRHGDFDDIALQAADDALVLVLARLDEYRGLSRFTTWAYKFALLEAAVRRRREPWQDREIPIEQDGWDVRERRARARPGDGDGGAADGDP